MMFVCNYFLFFVRVLIFVYELFLVFFGFLIRRVKSVVSMKILIGCVNKIFCKKLIVIEESYFIDFLVLNCILYIIINVFEVVMDRNVRLYVMYIN